MQNEQHAGHFFGGAHIERTNAPLADGALHRHRVREIGKMVIDRVARGARGLQRPVDARHSGADDVCALGKIGRRHE